MIDKSDKQDETGILPADSTQMNLLENGVRNPEIGEIERERLARVKDAHRRENELFDYAKKLIQALFIFAIGFIAFIAWTVGCLQASPWLITLGTVTFIVPTFLMGCVLHHIYGKDDPQGAVNLLAKTPIGDLLAGIKEIVTAWRTGK